jgi:Ni/Fe-hydrogenase subunit HybB-like protein
MNRVRNVKLALWLITGFAFAIIAFRFLYGLGASTNLNDATPWGMWIGFDLLGGVALAAGGFVICAFVYILKIEKFHGIIRPAVLTALLGYLAFIAGLSMDVGLPWMMWHVLINWNIHSAMFEVAWCVMLYTTVLMLEFLPVPLESTSKFSKLRKFLVKIRLPLVILGIMLSTLHQSSLGSLFLSMPHRLHPLWYSPLIPVMFFISAVGLGLAVVTLEGLVSSYLYKRGPEASINEKLLNASKWVLATFLGLRVIDLLVRGQILHAFDWDWRVLVFWAEITIGVIAPIALLSIKWVRSSVKWQWAVSSMVIFGIVWHRMNVGGFTHLDLGVAQYIPAWTEVAMSLGVVSFFGLIFLFAVEHFNIWEQRPKDLEAEPEAKASFDPVSNVWLGTSDYYSATIYSLAFIIAAAFGFASVSGSAHTGMVKTPVEKARGDINEELFIDGNHDGYGSMFNHQIHTEGGLQDSCVLCHHMNLPRDKNSPCSKCHADMYLPVDAFKHDWHSSPNGAKLSCSQCHPRLNAKTGKTAKKCEECHNDLIPKGAFIQVKQYDAPGYVDALHKLCIDCHEEKGPEIGEPKLSECGTCHRDRRDYMDNKELMEKRDGLIGKNVVVPINYDKGNNG